MAFVKFDRNSVLFFSKIIKLRCGKWGKICGSRTWVEYIAV